MRGLAVAARRVTAAAVLLAALAALLVSVAVRADAVRVSRVLTGSMGAAVPAGSVAVSRPAKAAGIEPGQVLMFVPPAPFTPPGGTPVVHRVVEVETAGDGAVLVRTKGDANDAVDPWTIDASKSTVFEVAWSSLAAGRVATVVAAGGGSLLLSVVVAIATARVLAMLWRPRRGRGKRRAPSGVQWLRDAAA